VANVCAANTPSSAPEQAAPSPVIEPPTNDQPSAPAPAPSNSDDNGRSAAAPATSDVPAQAPAKGTAYAVSAPSLVLISSAVASVVSLFLWIWNTRYCWLLPSCFYCLGSCLDLDLLDSICLPVLVLLNRRSLVSWIWSEIHLIGNVLIWILLRSQIYSAPTNPVSVYIILEGGRKARGKRQAWMVWREDN